MTRIGFHANHEQISPRQLLADVQHAERAGFEMAMCSDHLHPWSERQGHSGYTWSWLGAALATTELTFGCVCAPGQRYHPAIVAQKIGTLASMFPGRFWTALGSGEAVNEVVTGEPWPRKEVRVARLEESVDIIRRLLAGEEVTREGLIDVRNARVWDRPDEVPALIGPAISPESAARVAGWADGLITVNQSHAKLREVLDRYEQAGGTGPRVLQLHLSWAPTQDEAEAIAWDQWRSNVFSATILGDVTEVSTFDELSQHASREAVAGAVRTASDLGQHAEWIHEYAELGFDDIYLHFVGQHQAPWLDAAGERLLPSLR